MTKRPVGFIKYLVLLSNNSFEIVGSTTFLLNQFLSYLGSQFHHAELISV